MKKLTLLLNLVLLTVLGYSQTTAPDATKPYMIFDASYELEAVGSGTNTNVEIYYDNQTGNDIKAIQFKFWYDNIVFDTPTITYAGSENSADYYFQTNINGGSVTIVWVYKGTSTDFDISSGNMFNVELPFQPDYTNNAITNMSFTGAPSFTAYGATTTGTDTDLGLYNYGGAFNEPEFNFTATILNDVSNPAEGIDVILQKSSDGTSWLNIDTVTTNADGESSFTTNLDQNYWQVRIKIENGIDASSALSTADANMMAQIAAGLQSATGVQFFTANPNQSNGVTVADSYLVFSRLAQNNTSYPNNPDVLFFTEAQYNTISVAVSDPSSTIPGQVEFLSPLINNTVSGNYYMLVLGDANGTGLN
jgi:hypothetical protein